jgi:hypothetical protein
MQRNKTDSGIRVGATLVASRGAVAWELLARQM